MNLKVHNTKQKYLNNKIKLTGCKVQAGNIMLNLLLNNKLTLK